MSNYDSYEKALKTTCITQQPVFFLLLSQKHKQEVWNRRIGSFSENGRNYDVYEFDNPVSREREKIFFDITYFFGRVPLLLEPKRLNFPVAHFEKKISVKEMFGEQLVNEAFPDISNSDKAKLNSTTLFFEAVPSNIVSNLIAIDNKSESVIEVFPLREFHKDGFPMLYGYHFYILFIIHQLTHGLLCHKVEETEIRETKEARLIDIGVDCVSFTPIAELTIANDFVNYLFWTHQPTAFENTNEQRAFQRMAKFAFSSNLFSKDELQSAISKSKIDGKLQNLLNELLSSV